MISTDGDRVLTPLRLCADAAVCPTLFDHTAESELTLRSVYATTGRRSRFWFDFAPVFVDGTPAPFTVLGIAELIEDGLIASPHIVYDTSPIRGDSNRPHEIGSTENISG